MSYVIPVLPARNVCDAIRFYVDRLHRQRSRGRAPRRRRPTPPGRRRWRRERPTCTSSGGSPADLLFSDSERLATAAAEAGVDVVLETGEGLPHVYQIMFGTLEAAEATEQIGKFLRAGSLT